MIATAGTDEKVEVVEAHGANGVNYKNQDFADEVASFIRSSSMVLELISHVTGCQDHQRARSERRDRLRSVLCQSFASRPLSADSASQSDRTTSSATSNHWHATVVWCSLVACLGLRLRVRSTWAPSSSSVYASKVG